METSSAPNNKRNRIIGFVVGFTVCFAVAFGIRYYMNGGAGFEKEMRGASLEINRTCPVMVDKETRLDSTSVEAGNTFRYTYTLVNYGKDDIVADTLRKLLAPSIIGSARTSPELKIFRDHLTTLEYYYNDKAGEFILDIKVTPDLYKE